MWFKKEKEKMKWFKVVGLREGLFYKTIVKAPNERLAKLKVLKLNPNKTFHNLSAMEIPKLKKVLKKGQFTIVSLIAVFLTLVVYSALHPLLTTYLSALIAQSDSLSGFLLQLIPTFIVVSIILTIIFYVIPHREE